MKIEKIFGRIEVHRDLNTVFQYRFRSSVWRAWYYIQDMYTFFVWVVRKIGKCSG